jgi:hypothetical protein
MGRFCGMGRMEFVEAYQKWDREEGVMVPPSMYGRQ